MRSWWNNTFSLDFNLRCRWIYCILLFAFSNRIFNLTIYIYIVRKIVLLLTFDLITTHYFINDYTSLIFKISVYIIWCVQDLFTSFRLYYFCNWFLFFCCFTGAHRVFQGGLSASVSAGRPWTFFLQGLNLAEGEILERKPLSHCCSILAHRLLKNSSHHCSRSYIL